jgi:penicillin-binding protein 1B
MSGRHAPRRRAKKREPNRLGWFRFRVLLIVAAIFTVLFANYAIKLDQQVREQFEGQRWALPAKVYASPLELHPGKNVDAATFKRELQAVGYREVKKVEKAGEFLRRGYTFYLKNRVFDFWDGNEPERSLRIKFSRDGKVTQITDLAAKRNLVLLRLDPRLIGKIYPTHNEDRTLVSLDQVPDMLIKALLAMEDRQFFEHHGISFRGIGRAFFENLFSGRISQGGSTITQQLVKNLFLTSERTFQRKLNEAIMAISLEIHYDKKDILEAYLNEVYLGQNGNHAIHGVGMASWFYFNRPLEQLELPEIALLVALVQAASQYNPRRNPEKALERREVVLAVMVNQKIISPEIYVEATATPLNVTPEPPDSRSPYPAYLQLVREQLRRDYREEDLRSEGLQIFTTLEPRVQHKIEQALMDKLKQLEKDTKATRLQGAMIVTGTETGEVLAVVGDRNPRYSGYNRALNALRPIGSLVKPAIYLSALEDNQHFSLLTRVDDKSFEWKDKDTKKVWRPRNYDGKTHGQVPLIEALVHSYNLATVHLGFELGLDKVKSSIQRLGVTRDFRTYPSMLLGGVSLSPLDVTQMYQTIANGGFRVPLRSIREVLAHDGEPLKRYPLQVEQRFAQAPVFVLNYAMREVIRRGTGRVVGKELIEDKMILAGKTGTSNDLRDSWFAGFGKDLLAVTWVGRDDNRSIHLSGGQGAMKVWAEAMKSLQVASLDTRSPSHVQWRWVDSRRWNYSNYGKGIRMPFVLQQEQTLSNGIEADTVYAVN